MKLRWKQVLSVILSVAMVTGMVSIAEPKGTVAKAAEVQGVTLALDGAGANGAFTFTHSELPAEYQGDSNNWTNPPRYLMEAYVNDADQPQQIWIQFMGDIVYTWGGGNYLDNVIPTSSMHILKDTVLYEYDVDAGALVPNGKTMVLEETFKIVCQDGVWSQVEKKPALDVALEFASVDAGWWSFGHTELPVEYQGAGEWAGVANQRYQFSAYVDGSEETAIGWLEFDGPIVRIYNGAFPGQKAPTSSFYIPKGTVLRQCKIDDSNNMDIEVLGKELTLTEDISLVNRDGQWVKDEILDVTMSLDTESNNGVEGAFTFNHTKLPEEYQGNYDKWQFIRYQFDAYIDGSTDTTSVWIQFIGDKAYIYGQLHYEGQAFPQTSFYIPEGTLLKECSFDEETKEVSVLAGGRKLKLTEEIKLQVDENGSWNPDAIFDTPYDLVTSGASEYKILMPAKPTENELFAAEELQFFVKEATGVKLALQREGKGALPGKFLSVGDTSVSRKASVEPTYETVKSNGFVIKTVGDDCYIKGYSDMGTRNGVYEWLERCFDYTYYAPEVYKLTKVENKKLPDFDLTVLPSFEYRQSTGETLQNSKDAYRMRFNASDEIFVTGLSVHNSFTIIDPEHTYVYTDSKYKNWYSMQICANNSRDDKELPAQLCYSNTEMQAEYIKNLKNILADSDVSQMMIGMEDNNYWCTCNSCTAKKNTYGTNAAVMIQFANVVQEEISSWCKEKYPDREPVTLVFFAYHQSEQAPVKKNAETGKYEPIDESVRLHEDLGVMFAPVRASYAYSLNDSINSVFKERLQGWDALTDNLYTWTYASYTADPFIFFDTFGIMKENYQLLLNSGSQFIYDETIGFNKNGNPAWERAKAYVMSELQWDVNQDVNQLLEEFFDNYFKDASDIMMDLMEYNSNHIKNDIYPRLKYVAPTDDNYTTVRGNIFVPILEKYERYYASKSYLNGAFEKINSAYASIEKYKYNNPELYEELYERILLESMQFQYVHALTSQGIFDYWDKTATEDKWNFRVNFERLGLERIRSTWGAKELFTEIWTIPEYNHVEVGFAKLLPTGQICLTGEFVSGPDAKNSTIGEVYGDWVRYYGEISYEVDGKVIKEQVGIDTMLPTNADYNNASFYVESNYIKNNLDKVKNIKIEAGTMITQDSSKTSNYQGVKAPMCIDNTLQITNIDGEWTPYNEMEVSYIRNDNGFTYLSGQIVSGPNKGQSIKDAYGDWKTTMSSPITYTKSGTEVAGEAYWDLFNANMKEYNANIYLRCDDVKANFGAVSNITIKEGTMLEVYHQVDETMEVYPIRLANDLVLDKNGGATWAQEYNKVELTYDSYVSGQGLFFNAEIVAGPDAGKDLEDVYGHWVDAAIGAVTYRKGETVGTAMLHWSSCNDTGKKSQFYIWGDYDGQNISTLDYIEIYAGELIMPTASGYSKTPILIENGLRLGPTDQGWSDENHVELSLSSFDGRGFYLKADIIGGPDKGADYGKLYGDWKNAPMGEVSYIRNGEEQTMNVSWSSVNGGLMYVVGDFYVHINEITEFVFPKDTVLTPTNPDYCQAKTRIANKLHLVKTSDGWTTFTEEPVVTEITLSNDTINGARDTKVICMNASADPLAWGNYSQRTFTYKDSDGETRRHGGIKVNGEYPETVTLIKKWEGYWAIDLSSIISTLEYGSVVTLEGTLRSDKYYAVFNKISYIYNVDGSFSLYDEEAGVVENETVTLPETWVNIDQYASYDAMSAPLLKNGSVVIRVNGKEVADATLNKTGTYEITRVVQNAVKAEVVGSQPRYITYEQVVHLFKTGDANADDALTASDIVRQLKNKRQAANVGKGGSDLNGDGVINETDKDLLYDLLLGAKTPADVDKSYSDVAIGAISDMHYMANGRDGQNRINTIKALNYYKSQNVDVILFNADITDYGEVVAYQELVEDIKSVYPNENTRPTMIFTGDNHEWYDVWTVNGHTPVPGETFYTLQDRFNTELSSLRGGLNDANSHYVVDGYHFIGVSSDGMNGGYATYDEDTLTWLEERLEAAEKADSTKPIFLALHQAPKDTVISSDIEHYDSAEMDAILAKYPQLVIITSHTHKPVSNEQSIYHGKYTVLNTASLYTGAIGSTDTSLMSDKYRFAQGLLIRAKGNAVDVERCDFYNDAKIKDNWVFTVDRNS